MPPKKKGKKKDDKKSAAASKASEDDANAPAALLQRAALRIESLERQLGWRDEKLAAALEHTRTLRAQVAAYHADFEKEKEAIFDIASDMSRQYKSMQDEMAAKVGTIEHRLREQSETLEQTRGQLREAEADKERALALKDAEMAEQRKKMEEMAVEFGSMLKETLDKMSAQIDTGGAWDGSKATASSVTARLQSFRSEMLSEGS